jgi:hypothetical protein
MGGRTPPAHVHGRRRVYAEASRAGDGGEGRRRVRLADVAREEGEAFVYEYDLGDSWRHQVLVEEVIAGGADEAGRPRCLGGERACPPEDSGGVGGFYDKLLTLGDPENDEHESTRVWVESMTGGPFDPDAFDLEAANESIEALLPPPSPRLNEQSIQEQAVLLGNDRAKAVARP